MGKYTDTAAVTRELSPSMSDMAFARFKSFCSRILDAQVDEIPTTQSIFMKQNLAIVFCGTFLFLLTNGFYLVKNHILRTTLPLDMIPLYMMVGACLAMLVFLLCCKDYGAPAARFALLAFYTVVIAAVTVFMVSCNYHGIGLSISMCYLFLIMIAPTYALSDTVFICVLILVSWYLPGKLPYAENYDLFKHFLLRVSIIIGFIVLHSIFLRQAADKRHIQEMSNTFIKLAYNDIMTGTLNKKALKTYCAFVTEKQDPERVSAIIYDIDDFKSYNDHYSHMKGDRCCCGCPRSSSAFWRSPTSTSSASAARSSRWFCPTPPRTRPAAWPASCWRRCAPPPSPAPTCRTGASSPPPSAWPAARRTSCATSPWP